VSVRSCDVLVVGAGPAGSAAAIVAARSGLDVVLADKATFPRDKCCGDGLTAGALRLLEELGVTPAQVPSWLRIDEVHTVGPSGYTVDLTLPQGRGQYAAVARRRELDRALVDRAAHTGACVLQGCEVSDVDTTAADRVRACVGGSAVQARYLVAADGMWSPVRRQLGGAPAGYLGDWHAFRQYFSGASEQARRQLVVWFERDLLPGYAWSFPLADGSVNVGFGIRRDGSRRVQDMKQVWEHLLERPTLRRVLGEGLQPEGTHRAWPIPSRLDQLDKVTGRVLFAGDAAGATDPMTGEGIGQAIETGMLAARSLAAAGPHRPEEAGALYTRTLDLGMVRDHQLARRLSDVLARPRGVELAMRLSDLSGWTRRNFTRWLFEDYPRAVALTPARWRPGLLSAPGAFPDPAQPDHAA
jgi:geranylgeranyl reductase family protein